MELEPQKYNNVSGISELVTVSSRVSKVSIADANLILGYHRLRRILCNHWSLLEDLFGLLFPTNHH